MLPKWPRNHLKIYATPHPEFNNAKLHFSKISLAKSKLFNPKWTKSHVKHMAIVVAYISSKLHIWARTYANTKVKSKREINSNSNTRA